MNENNLFSDCQQGFRNKRNCVRQLLVCNYKGNSAIKRKRYLNLFVILTYHNITISQTD